MSKQNQNNYINKQDKLLGDIDRTRLSMHEATRGMTVEQELAYHQNKLGGFRVVRDRIDSKKSYKVNLNSEQNKNS